jgi:anthranilate phosphoribosyltransferase
MQPELSAVVETLSRRESPSEPQIEAAVGCLMDGKCTESEIASLLTALAISGETGEQLAGAARAMRARALRIPTTRTGLLDTCGTGGDRLNTFNISTATAIVAAAAGVPVAKHGNRSATSTTGSADVLERLGVKVTLTPEQVGNCLDEIGLGFCFARTLHTAMRFVAPVRSMLPVRTIFNLLGPLTNPARAEFQLLGTNRAATAKIMAEAAARLGTTRTFVVCGADQLDEVALWGKTIVYDVTGSEIRQHEWTAASFGLPDCRVDDLIIHGPEQSAEVIRKVLVGTAGAAKNMLLANTAAALHLTGRTKSLTDGVQLAAEAIDSGRAKAFLDRLAAWTQACPDA